VFKLVTESVRWRLKRQMNRNFSELHRCPSSSAQAAGVSPRPLASHEDEDPSYGDEAVLEGGHGQDGELGSILQWKDSEQPPTPSWTAGTSLQENKVEKPFRFQFDLLPALLGHICPLATQFPD